MVLNNETGNPEGAARSRAKALMIDMPVASHGHPGSLGIRSHPARTRAANLSDGLTAQSRRQKPQQLW